MKKFSQLIFSISVLFIFSCKPQKQANEMSAKPTPDNNTAKETALPNIDATVSSVNPDQAIQVTKDMHYRFIVSFISIGEGTDRNGKEIFASVLNDWKTNHKQEVNYETIQWGREGEVDFCFPLSEINDVLLQQEFVRRMKEAFKGHTLVQFAENEPCLHKR